MPEAAPGTEAGGKNGVGRHIQPLESLKIDNFSFTFDNSGAAKNTEAAYYYPMSTNPDGQKSLRIYTGCKWTLTAPQGAVMSQIVINGTNGKNLSTFTVNTGNLQASEDNKVLTWTGEANAVTFTHTAQFRPTTIEVTYTTGGTVTPTAQAPVFTPAACGFTDEIAVSIAAADGATIYYTLDGNAPTTASEKYVAPIMLNATTTVKAIAVEEGKQNSPVVSATYTLEVAYNTLAELINAGLADTKSEVKFAGNAVVVYQNGKYLYLKDDSAPMLVYGALSQEYTPGDVITGFSGKMSLYKNLKELNATASTFGAPVGKQAAPAPEVVDIEDVTTDMMNKYVALENVKFVATTTGEGEDAKTTYTMVDPKDADIIAYNRFSMTFPTDSELYNVYGFVSVFGDDLQVYPSQITLASSVDSIETAEGQAVYYNLQGVQVAPAKGQLLIKVQAGKAAKVIF